MDLEFPIYKCTSCEYLSTHPNVVRIHHTRSKKCRDSGIQTSTATASFDQESALKTHDDDDAQQIAARPGPKGVDIPSVMRGRVPAFRCDDALDARIDYLCDTHGILDSIFNPKRPVRKIPFFIFRHAWGDLAPKHFQSIVAYGSRSKFVEVIPQTLENQMAYEIHTETRAFVSSILRELLMFIEAMCRYSIPERRPEHAHTARALLSFLRTTEYGVTLTDILESNEQFHQKRRLLRYLPMIVCEYREVLKNHIECLLRI